MRAGLAGKVSYAYPFGATQPAGEPVCAFFSPTADAVREFALDNNMWLREFALAYEAATDYLQQRPTMQSGV